MINVEVEKNPNENNANVIRRFTKKMQSAGVLQRVRSLRYYSRSASALQKKKSAIKSIGRKAKYEEMFKLGKVIEKTPRKGRS